MYSSSTILIKVDFFAKFHQKKYIPMHSVSPLFVIVPSIVVRTQYLKGKTPA